MSIILKNIAFKDHPDSPDFKQLLLNGNPIYLDNDEEHERLFDDEDIDTIKMMVEEDEFLINRSVLFNYSDDIGMRSFSNDIVLTIKNNSFVLKNNFVMATKTHFNFDENDEEIEVDEDEDWDEVTVTNKDESEMNEDDIRAYILGHVENSLDEFVDIYLVK